METIQFSYFLNAKSRTEKTCTDFQVIEWLKHPKMQQRIEEIRALYDAGKDKEADALKAQLPAITPSGVFEGSHANDKLITYSHIVCLDFDGIPKEKVSELKDRAAKIPYTCAVFTSPGGSGIKVWVRVSSGSNYHREAYVQVSKLYEKELGHPVDQKASNVGRLMYLSFDSDIYHYPDSDVFPVATPISTPLSTSAATVVKMPNTGSSEHDQTYKRAYDYTCKKEQYISGNKNNFVFLLACNANKMGLPKEELLRRLDWCDKDPKEVNSTINSAYKRADLFGTWNKSWNAPAGVSGVGKVVKIDAAWESEFSDTPTIAPELLRRLPDLVSGYVLGFEDARQRDMATLTMLTLLSGTMNEVFGEYDGKIIHAPLFSLVTSGTAAGKGVMNRTLRFFEPLHQHLFGKAQTKHGFLLSENATCTSFTKRLADNRGFGALFSADAGFLGHLLKHDAQGLRAILRTAQSGERFSNGRSLKRSVSVVNEPKLAACLTATPQDLTSLLGDPENGSVSRFLHYHFDSNLKWREIKMIGVEALLLEQQKYSSQIMALYNYLQEHPFEFRWTEEQLLALNETFASKLASVTGSGSSAVAAIIKRLGEACCRLTMVLTAVKTWEQQRTETQVYCSDEDFDIAMQLTDVFLQHGSSLVNYIGESNGAVMDAQLQKLYDALPSVDVFTRKQAQEVAKTITMNVSERTIDAMLKKLVDLGRLTRGYNNYQKVQQAEGLKAA